MSVEHPRAEAPSRETATPPPVIATPPPVTAAPPPVTAAPPTTATDAVFNQSPPLEDVNLFRSHRALVEALRREGAAWAEAEVAAFGELAGRRETIAWGFQANAYPPALRTHDRTGRRIDEVEFHPAWHALLALGVEHGLHALPWRPPYRGRPGAHVARAAKFMLLAQVEAGVGCPLSMTYAGVAALDAEPALDRLRRDLPAAAPAAPEESQARRLVEGLATTLQASLLIRHAPAAVSGAFCASRLDERGLAFGTLPPGTDHAAILERHDPDDPDDPDDPNGAAAAAGRD